MADSTVEAINLALLRAPFKPEDIEWRASRTGVKNGGGWVQAVAYIDNRAVQNRLDDVCGPENWRNEYKAGPDGGVLAGISIKLSGEWVTKWDGAENTSIESVKGGLSDAMKRAAVQWGIGRYLYEIESAYCPVRPSGDYWVKIKQDGGPTITGYWSAPTLPKTALPVRVDGPKVSDAQLITGIKTEAEPEVDNPPTGAQVIKIKNLYRQAGADEAKRDEWLGAIKTKDQAEQAIKKLQQKIDAKVEEGGES